MGQKLVIALAGNPNSGKTTVFNALTGARQHVGNYPGVTVERKEGFLRHGDNELQIVDLPGTYSLTAYSTEELVARNFLVEEKPDVVVDILDASNLERNLYLAVQLKELGVPLVLAFNMSDQAKARGYEFNLEKLSQAFGARIVPTVGHKGEGISELLEAVVQTAQEGPPKFNGNNSKTALGPISAKATIKGPQTFQNAFDYGPEIEAEIGKLESLLKGNGALATPYTPRWLSIKLLEKDKELRTQVDSPAISAQIEASTRQIEQQLGEAPELVIAGRRYLFLSKVCQDAVRSTIESGRTLTDKLDAVVTNRVLGIPIFLGLMYLMFQLTFTLGAPFMDWIETFFGWLGGLVQGMWPEGSESVLLSLLVDGVIGGVGGVLVFLPNVLLLFFAIALLEDSGYMARAAFLMDRIMHRLGLHGKSFIPMLLGFGCSIPAIMATRTLENERDRLTTMLVVPLMSCGARLPIYALIIPAFFPQVWHAPMLWIIYLIGLVLAIVVAKLLRSTVFKGEAVPFVMELPPYRMPTLKGVLLEMWARSGLYLQKAGTIILVVSILLWAMTSFPKLPAEKAQAFETQRAQVAASSLPAEAQEEQLAEVDNSEADATMQHSIAGRIGRAMEPALKPLGFDWRIGTALIGAFAAKEVFVAQLGIVYSVGEADEESESLRDKLKNNYSPLTGFCIMLFCLISAPCMATIAVTRRESGSWKWALLQLGGLTGLAYLLTLVVYQVGLAFGLGVG